MNVSCVDDCHEPNDENSQKSMEAQEQETFSDIESENTINQIYM